MREPGRLGLIVGGVQKGGTTSLYGYFCDHPRLLSGSRKELHFFDDEAVDWNAPDYSRLHREFVPAANRCLPFDVTPNYLFWPPSLGRIAAYNPAAKLIFIFRDPIERAWSHWKMELSRGAESLPFHLAIKQGRWRLRGIDPLDPAWRVYSYVERGFYGRQLRRAFSLFPRENILLLRSNDLRDNHAAVLAQVAGFLQIEPFPVMSARSDHRSPSVPDSLAEDDVVFLRDLFRDDLGDFVRLSNLSVHDWPAANPTLAVR